MPAISTDDHHSAVNPHKAVQRLLAFALECYFPIIAFTPMSYQQLSSNPLTALPSKARYTGFLAPDRRRKNTGNGQTNRYETDR